MSLVSVNQKPYRPIGRLRDFWAYRGREVLVAGPAGTGKSLAALNKLYACAALFSGMRGLICRKQRTTLTQSALASFNDKVLIDGEYESTFHHGDQEYRLTNGSIIAVAGLDDPEKVKSSEYDLIYVQEATDLDEDDWSMLLRGLRNGVMPYQQIMADCNPAGPSHWLKQRVTAGALHLIESQHTDNPALWSESDNDWTNQGREYIATLDSLTGFMKRRLRYGEWVASEGMYFTEWNPDIHVCEAFDIPKDWPCWTSTDWGFADPWCVLWFARDPESRRIYVYREFYRSGIRDHMQAQYIARASHGERIIANAADPSMFNARTESNRPSIASVYAQNGVGLVPASNNRIAGWQAFRRVLAGKQSRLQIMAGRCPNLVRTIPEMVQDPLDPEDLADKIKNKKTDDHAVDAARYGLMHEAAPRQAPSKYGFGSDRKKVLV